MKTRYFYTIGEYLRRVPERSFYSHYGWDARSWFLTNEVKEVSKEGYDRIVKDDKRIVKRHKTRYNMIIITFHKPFKLIE